MKLQLTFAAWLGLLALTSFANAQQIPDHPAFQDFPREKAPYLGVYRWGAANKSGGAKAVTEFSRWIDKPVWAEDFEAKDRWENNISGGGWQLGEWRDWKKAVPGRRLILSVPMLPGDWNRGGPKGGPGAGEKVSLQDGADGKYNKYFEELAKNLVKFELGDSVLRLGWEMNGGWYTWRGSDNPKAWGQFFAQIVKTMRAVPGMEKTQYCFNPAMGWQQFPSDQAWPGDEYVDIVGVDIYDDSWATDTYPLTEDLTAEQVDSRRKKVWSDVVLNGQFGLKYWKDFSIKHNKLFSIPEWGVSRRPDKHGGLDNPYFIEQMHKFINDPANNVYFHVYFDVQAPDGAHQVSTGISGTEKTEFPNSAAKFLELFGGTNAGQPKPATP